MLTIEEIKKIFDNFDVEGFRYDKDLDMVISPDGLGWTTHSMCDTRWNNVYYPLCLQKVIEGINYQLDIDYCIEQSYSNVIYVAHNENGVVANFINTERGEDQAKEEAIKYVLKEIGENKC